MGYHRAGFDVVGVDLDPKMLRQYPFPCVRADAMTFSLRGFDAVHASPPCQDFSCMCRATGKDHGTGWMLQATIDRLSGFEGAWVVENVPGAPFDANLVLCGESFGLAVIRHRLFMTRPFLLGPQCHHDRNGIFGTGRYVAFRRGKSPHTGKRPIRENTRSAFRDAMGIDWMGTVPAAQAIPPAYTEWIGKQLLEQIS